MTVEGKGGRPRKWNSDADRVRAFRARARGDEEPAAVEQLVNTGGEAGFAWAQVAELTNTVRQHKDTIRSLERELHDALKVAEEVMLRCSRLESTNELLRAREQHVSAAPTRSAGSQHSTSATAEAAAPNRAQRRAAERDSRRRPQ